jgi:5'-nucleotidase / UDP-sugar diphosphatase
MKLFNLFLGAIALSHHAVTVVTAQLPANLSIVHINDHHSNVDELNLDLPRSMWPAAIAASINVNITAIRMKYGSFARVTALIKQLSAEAAAAGFDVTRLHAGDAITGTNYFSFFGSTVDAAMLNLAGFDAMTLGNHEFDKVKCTC